MKQTKGLKLNVLLAVTCVLLLFVCLTINQTGAWLTNNDSVSFTAQVDAINIELKQGDRVLSSNDNNIYLGTDVIEADATYNINLTLTNKEENEGYFVRYKVVAQVNGAVYNINDYITTSLYKHTDGWIYVGSSSTPVQMSSNQTETIISSITIPATADSGKLSISTLQGKLFRLYLYVQGSPVNDFTA